MRFRMTREMQIPKGAVKIADKQSDCVAYIYSMNDKPCALMFVGKADKAAWRYRFGDVARRDKAIAETFNRRRERTAAKQEDRAKRKAWVNPYKVGDLFRRSWGYDQTNVDWYEVVAVSGKMVTVREITQERIYTGDMCGKTTPQPGEFKANEPAKRCLAQDGCIKINHYAHAYFVKPEIKAGVPVYMERTIGAHTLDPGLRLIL